MSLYLRVEVRLYHSPEEEERDFAIVSFDSRFGSESGEGSSLFREGGGIRVTSDAPLSIVPLGGE